jgi:hypothetical protein
VQVYSHGGDVMRFAGDSVICAFLPMPEEAEAEDKGLAAATLRRVRCAAVLADDLGAFSYLVAERPSHRPSALLYQGVAHPMSVPLLELVKTQKKRIFAGAMRMLMDGRVVALPEQEHRGMRAAAAAKRAQQEAALGSQHAT